VKARQSRTESSNALNVPSADFRQDFYSAHPTRGQNPMFTTGSNIDFQLQPIPQYRPPKNDNIRVGMVCQGQWDDGNYYRVRIHSYSEVLGYLVNYVDFSEDRVYLSPAKIKA